MRNGATWALIALACVAAVLALLVGYVRRAAVDSDQFANRATVALHDASVRSLIAERVTDQVVLERKGDLLAARPLIQSIVSSVIGTRAFTGVFRSGVRDVHRAVFHRDQDTVTLTIADAGTIVAAALDVVRPGLADQVRATGRVEVARRRIGAVGGDTVRAVHAVGVLAWLLLGIAIGAAAGAIALARDRRRTVARLGVGIAIGGVVVVFLLAVARSIAVGQTQGADARDAARAVWDAFLGDLTTAAWLLAAAGAVVAAAAASLIRPVDIGAPLRRAAAWARTEPRSPAWRVARGGALVGAGLVVLLARDAVVRLAVTLAGLYLVYVGISAILWVVYVPRAAGAPAQRGPRRRRALLGGAIAAVVIAAGAAAFVGGGGTSTAAPAFGTCEGARALCDRSLEQIALPATHNSMSVPLPGWYAAEQEHPIAQQLSDGIRGLLVDTHYADRLANGRLRTVLSDPKLAREQARLDGLSPEAIDAAMRLRERLGFAGKGTRGMYLCHGFCELGGTPLASVLTDLHDFLVANPGEIVVLINQDYVTPADFVAAARRAGLADMAYSGPTAPGSWPTLRAMIASGKRLVVLAENAAGAAPWYRSAYRQITQETPYTFPRAAQLTDPAQLAASCRPNRGSADAPLLLVNHWIAEAPLPLPSSARTINAYAPLLRRLRTCERIRRHIPNLVAVNFYGEGDLLGAVAALNGTG